MMVRIQVLVLFIIISFSSLAQRPEGKPGAKKSATTGEVFGQIIDSLSGEQMEYAAVSLYGSRSEKLITGGISNINGKFSLVEVPVGKYFVTINFVGYEQKTIRNVNLSEKESVVNLGKVLLSSDNTLEEIVLDGSTPTISYEIDKKIVDVSNLDVDLGQSAVEILENVPSINVDIDGAVSLRGSSSFTLLINGQPTAMDASDALATIPASSIKNIEIITNPSAKYEAEGVSGIMNIITKNNKLEGVSALVNLSGGNYENYAGDASVNVRKKKTEFNIGVDIRNRTRPNDSYTERFSDYDSLTTTVTSEGERDWRVRNSGINGEFVWNPNSAHVFTIGGRYNQRLMNRLDETQFMEYSNDVNVLNYLNSGNSLYDINSSSTYLSYRLNINRDKEHYINIKGIYNHRFGDDEVLIDYLDANNQKIGGTRNTEVGPSGMYRFNLDYSKKFKSGVSFETGSQIQFGESNESNRNYNYDTISEDYILDTRFSSDAYYVRNIGAVYALVKGKKSKFGYQFGLRAEYTDRTITAESTNQFTEINRLDFFPTIHFSFELPKNNQLLVNYTRRIQRPRSWYLEPFVTWENNYTISTGNPNLSPEYIDAFEVNWIKDLSRKGSISVEGYFRYVQNFISRVEIPVPDTTNLISRSPLNVGETFSVGVEPTFSYKLYNWWKIDVGANLFFYSINSAHEQIRSSENFNWNSRFTNTFPLSNSLNVQLASRYVGGANTVQGRREGYFTMNGSIKKSFVKNKYSLAFQLRDMFSTIKNESYTQAGNVETISISEPRTPTFLLTFSMRFNNYRKKLSEGESDDF